MKKVLLLSSVASMIDQFNMQNIILLQEQGYTVNVACNFINGNTCSNERIKQLQDKLTSLNVEYFQIDFARNITSIKQNIKAYKQVFKLVAQNNYEFIHCHSPIGGVIGRLVGKKLKTKLIYTAHGFHFYKGAPLKNWLVYYSVEKFLSRWTDVLITINHEDYMLAKKKMHAKKVYYVPGVGIDVDKFANTIVDKDKKREEIGVPPDAFLLLSVGELNKNKNHEVVIRAIAQIKNQKIHYAIAGRGELKNYLYKLASELGVSDRVHLLGYRNDIAELYKAADVCCFPSIRGGLGLAALEGMASGLPLIASYNRGTVEYAKNKINAFLHQPNDVNGYIFAIQELVNNEELCHQMANKSTEIIKQFDISVVTKQMKNIYLSLM